MYNFSLHNIYIKPTLCLHTFRYFGMISVIFSIHTVTIQPPIKQNPDSHFAYFTINATREFSREFDAYLPISQSLVCI